MAMMGRLDATCPSEGLMHHAEERRRRRELDEQANGDGII